MDKPRVAIVGAGISGLVSLKECLAEGLEAVIFDDANQIGGGWVYDPDASSGRSSIYSGCMLNSCRDATAFSDFPLDPSRYPDFFRHELFRRYIEEYAEHFALAKHIRLRTKVLECLPLEDGTWKVRVQEQGGEVEEQTYTAVIAATGHLSRPKTPDFPGKDTFEGEFLHSHYYRSPGRFEGKRVVIIGLGASTLDIACEVGPQAKELRVIARRGAWVLPRFVLGKPLEAWDNRATQLWVPSGIAQWAQKQLLHFVDGKPPKELMPDHNIMSQNAAVRGDFLEKVRSGLVKIERAGVERITPTGIVCTNGTTFEDVDVIISATGYDHYDLPFLPADVARSESTPPHLVDLYKIIQPPKYRNLFLHGWAEPIGSLPPTAEAQARYTAGVLSGRVKVPSEEKMYAEIRADQKKHAEHYIHSERHASSVHFADYIDDLLRPLGAVPTFPKMLWRVFSTGHPWRSWKVLSAVWFGMPITAAWRVCGHGADPALAEEALLRVNSSNKDLTPREKEVLPERRGKVPANM